MSLDVKRDRADTVPMTSPASLHLLHAGPVDSGTLTRLAALDESEPLTGEVLLAIADGEAVAAMSVDDGRVIADPFARTREAVELLRMRARLERRRSGTPRRFGLRRLGLAA
jgi:hypothetical protein